MKNNTGIFFLVAVLSAFTLCVTADDDKKINLKTDAEITAEEFINNIKYLASDALGGRGNGSKGMEMAAETIRENFRSAGLVSLGEEYFQPFEILVGSSFGENNSVMIMVKDQKIALTMKDDYVPMSYATDDIGAVELVFAGYGISAPQYNYDDYANLDVKNKVVIVFDLEPQRDKKDSVFDGTLDTQYAQVANKIMTARSNGAAGIIIVNGPKNKIDADYELPKITPEYVVQKMGLAAVKVRLDQITPVLYELDLDLAKIQDEIDADLKPRSKALDAKVDISIDLKPTMKTIHNVVGMLKGTDEKLSEEYILIGAHYDHLGGGQFSSMSPDKVGEVHNGADDNASGTSGLMEIAEYLAAKKDSLKRSVIFMAFAGEEMGLLGSAHFVNNPLVKKENIIAMLNMDMIGRVENKRLTIGGIGTAKPFKDTVENAAKGYDFDLSLQESGFASSDNASFVAASIPSLFFFSGTHRDYHTPSDDWDRINVEDGTNVAKLVGELAEEIANYDQRPEFQRTTMPTMGGGRRAGNRPWFGSMPDFSYKGEGYRFQAINPESPAAAAGLKAGDILVEFAGKKIGNIYDYTAALGAFQPGDTVDVVVLRDGEEVKAKVTLTRRK